jgi:hypothetical protein
MTADQLIREIESLGGTLTLNGDRIRCELTDEAKVLVPELQRIRDEVYRVLLERDHPAVCPVHGAGATWWNLADVTAVCGRCHPDPFDTVDRVAAQSGPVAMPAGVRLLRWEPKQPPIAVTTFSVVTDPQKFIEGTLQQLEAALRGNVMAAGNWSVRDLCERLEQVGIRVAVAQKG